MGLLFKNNAETTLSSGINNSTTTVPVASAAVFPTPNANNVFFATIDDGTNVEVVKVTAISSNDLTVVRAQDNTSAAAFGSGAKIELRLNAKVLDMGTSSLTDLDGDTKIQVEETADDDDIRFDTAGSERMKIDSIGHVSVGSRGTNPLGLSISGTVLALSEGSNVASLQIDGVTGTRIDMGTNGSRNAVFYTDANQLEISRTTNHPIKFVVNSSEIARLVSTELKLASGKKLVGGGSGVDLTIQSEHRTEIRGGASAKGTILLSDAGTVYGLLERPTSTNDFDIQNPISNGDITFVGNDGGSTITALTLDMSDAGRAMFNGSIDIGGSNITRTGDLTIDVSGDIILDADGENIKFLDGGVERGQIDLGSANFTLRASTSDKDMIFRVNDGGSEIVALTIDASEAGAATFNSTVSFKFLNNTWISSAEGDERIYFANSGETYLKADGSHLFRNGSDTTIANIDSSGNGTFAGNVTAYGSPSDIKLKENIEVIENALDKVKQLKGITYDLKSDGNRLTGLIAQDLEKVLPEAVYTSETIADERKGEESEEHLAIRYGNTVGLLVEAIKEQQEQIEALTARIKKLEGK